MTKLSSQDLDSLKYFFQLLKPEDIKGPDSCHVQASDPWECETGDNGCVCDQVEHKKEVLRTLAECQEIIFAQGFSLLESLTNSLREDHRIILDSVVVSNYTLKVKYCKFENNEYNWGVAEVSVPIRTPDRDRALYMEALSYFNKLANKPADML